LIATPGQLNQRSEFYHQLGAMLAAGVTFSKGLEVLEHNPPGRSYVRSIGRLREYISQGFSPDEAFVRLPGFAPDFDLALLEAGSKSGRLDICLRLLSQHYSERARLVRSAIDDLLYPLFVIHFAAVVFPFIGYFQDSNLTLFVARVGMTLLPVYAVAIFLIYACQGNRGLAWRSKVEVFMQWVPVLGAARRQLALSRLSAALESLLNAGVPIIGGWQLAATASGSPALAREVASWVGPLESGATPAELVSQSRLFPEVFANLYSTGELSGTLDDTLKRLHTYFQDEGQRRMRLVAQWGPRLFYLAVALFIGYRIVAWYASFYNGQITPLLEM
jgi:type II secretory pathway component PulF